MIFFREEVCKKFWKELYVLKTQLENFHKIETKFYEIMKSESSDGDLETFLNDKTGLLKNYAEIIKNCDSIKYNLNFLRANLNISILCKLFENLEKVIQFKSNNYSKSKAELVKYLNSNINELTRVSTNIFQLVNKLQKTLDYLLKNKKQITDLFNLNETIKETNISEDFKILLEESFKELNLNVENSFKRNLLSVAVRDMNPEISLKLIQLNPKQVEFEDKSGFNPLTYALRANMEKVAIKMIEVHPEILKKGYPLDYLSIGINKECEKFCLKLVEMINPKKLEELDRNGDGPLAYACRQRQDKLVTKIINKNPNTIKVLDRLKQLPLIDLYKAGKSEKLTLAGNYAFIPSCTPLLIQMLTLCPDAITLKDKKGKSLLYWCSVVHDEETMLEIIKIRPDTIEEQFSILQKYPKLIEIIKTKYPEFINKEFS